MRNNGRREGYAGIQDKVKFVSLYESVLDDDEVGGKGGKEDSNDGGLKDRVGRGERGEEGEELEEDGFPM